MKEKKIWAACLILLGLATVCLGLSRLLWAGVPDAVVRILGIIILVALVVFVFYSVRLAAKRK